MNRNKRRVAWCGRRPHAWVAVLLTFVFLVESCKSEKGPVETAQPPSTAQGVDAAPGAPAPQGAQGGAAPAVAAPAVTQASWSPDALEELLAPIALYPDQLLGQILAASVNSQEVMDGGNWLLQNQNLTGNDLDAAAQEVGFGPAMRALLQYPTVVDMMCQEIDWTRQLGSAFSSDQKSVLDAVQRLRKEAADVGNLKSTPQQTVSTKTEGGNVYVEVKPADPQIVYVPQYDPQAVYTTPPPAQAAPAQAAPAAPATTTTTGTTNTTTTTTEKEKDGVSTGTAAAIGLIAFVAGAAIGSSMHDDYYYPSWGYGGVYYGPRPYYPAAYVYRPVYGPAFRPAYGYRPPVNYRYNYNNVRANNNIIVNNKNYYNRFNNNQNLRTGGTRSPIASTQPRAGQNRVGQPVQTARRDTASNWKGQSSYAGARDNTRTRETPRAGNASPATTPRATGQRDRPTANTRETQVANRDAERTPTRTADASQRIDRGYGDTPPAESRQAATSTPARLENRTTNANPPPRTENRQTTASAPSRPQPSAEGSAPKREHAFSGAERQGDGNFQRAASARGNASVGSRQTSGGHARRR